MHHLLNEKLCRQFLALEAKSVESCARGKRGRRLQKSHQSGKARNRDRRPVFPGQRLRGEGGGRKKQEEHDASLQSDLEALLDPKGDPMSPIQWTTKSVAKLNEALKQQGHHLGDTAISIDCMRCASHCVPTRKLSKGVRMRIAMPSLDISSRSGAV